MAQHLRFLVVLIAAFALSAGPALAEPDPFDGNSSAAQPLGTPLLTQLFGLGEVDLSTLGVNPLELATVGPSLAPTAAEDNMLIVDDGLDCPNAEYLTVQSAVNAATPGDMIKVCRGTYIEQVTIPAGKDEITLFSVPALQAVIKAPPVMADPKAIVRVSGAQEVTIRHFTITGPGGAGCDSIRWGVRVDTNGSALITDNHITEIHDTPFSGCQNGIGVLVGRGRPDLADNSPGSGQVVHNLIDRYQKGGVVVDNTGTSAAEVAYNEVTGMPTPIIAQNGIQVSRAGRGEAHHNKVSLNQYLPAGTDATGILLFSNTAPVRAHHNELFLNDAGAAVWMTVANAEIAYNNARNNEYGIAAYEPSDTNLITHNKAFENTEFDCRDDNIPTTNRWVKDLGRTESQPGLCKRAGPQ